MLVRCVGPGRLHFCMNEVQIIYNHFFHHLPPRLDMSEDVTASVSKALYIQDCLSLDNTYM